jgi:hypothetical protein
MPLDKVEFGTPLASAAPRKLRVWATSTNKSMSLSSSMVIAPFLDQCLPIYHLYLSTELIQDTSIAFA